METGLWRVENIGLIGQDALLQKKVYPRITHPSKCFVLKGAPGSGKTALLEWAHEHTDGASSLVNARLAISDVYRQIIQDWDLDLPQKGAKLSALEDVILGSEGKHLYVDDLHLAKPRVLYIFKVLAQYHKFNGAIVTRATLKDEHKQLIMSREVINVPKLSQKDALRLARRVALQFKSKADIQQVVQTANGNPRNIISLITSGEIPRSCQEFRLRHEEIDISPVFLGIMVGVLIFRILGRSIQASDFAAIGSLTMVMRLLLMPFLRGGKEK